MQKFIKKLKEKKGFTLVELIVVLVILAILAALLIPSLTGYIDKANEQKIISETRMVAMAVQTEATTFYGKNGQTSGVTWAWGSNTGLSGDTTNYISNIISLAEVADLKKTTGGATFKATCDSNCAIKTVEFQHGKYTCTYDAASATYKVATRTDGLGNTVEFS